MSFIDSVCLIGNDFYKHVMRLWFMAIKEKDIHRLKKVFKGFKDQGSPFASQLLFSFCPCRRNDLKIC